MCCSFGLLLVLILIWFLCRFIIDFYVFVNVNWVCWQCRVPLIKRVDFNMQVVVNVLCVIVGFDFYLVFMQIYYLFSCVC